MNDYYTSVELGTDTIKILVCQKVDNDFHVIAQVCEKSQGIKKGIIVDTKQAITSVKKALKKINEMLQVKITKAIVAPNVAASDTPKVEGEAIGLLRQYCIMAPDNVNPVPTSKEAITLLNLIFPIMIFAFLLPALKSPFNISRNSSPLESISKAKKKDRIKIKNNIPRATK